MTEEGWTRGKDRGETGKRGWKDKGINEREIEREWRNSKDTEKVDRKEWENDRREKRDIKRRAEYNTQKNYTDGGN